MREKKHTGKQARMCPLLKAHTTEMEIVTEEKYVGDIISNDGKHTKNIKLRRSKGIGICNEIMTILNNMFLGPYYFEVALLLRKALLLSVMLFNAETWRRLTKESIKKLEAVDLMLLRKLLQTPISSPKASLYLETGCVPLRYHIKAKRIMYLHHILTREDDALIKRVLMAQISKTTKGDWCVVVREDLDSIGLSNLSFEDISSKTKETLKKLVTEKIIEAAFTELEGEKRSLSKVAMITYEKLEIQPYLVDANLSTRIKRLVYKWRTRMIKVGWNYGEKVKCPICLQVDDTQIHLLECQKLHHPDELPYGFCDDQGAHYNLREHMQQLEAAIRKRETILEESEVAKD